MKATLLIISMSLPVAASEKMDLCLNLEVSANKIMTMRQNGVAMSKLAKAIGDNKLGISILKEAYGVSKKHSDNAKLNAISDFADKTMIGCINAMESNDE